MTQYKVTFLPEGTEVEVPAGSTVMDAINQANISLDFPCGGKGKCGKCRVKIDDSIRLACLSKVSGHMTVELALNTDSNHQILMTSAGKEVSIDPQVTKVFVQVQEPNLDEPKSDWQRLTETLAQQGLNPKGLNAKISTLRALPEQLRTAEHRVTAVAFGNEVLQVEPGDTTGRLLGMAFDIGTTTIVGYLMDLSTGKELAVASTVNPQAKYGADVISRIAYAGQDGKGLEQLHTAVTGAINKLIADTVEQVECTKEDVYAVMIAGNTTMHHLFLGINPKYLSASPYVSVYNEAIALEAPSLGININHVGKVLVLPNIAGFVGADTTAVLLAAELEKSDKIKLMIDIGTNGEIVLGSKEGMFSCSAAAGPAFEGAEITFGMRGAEGAIDHVYFNEVLEYSVIGGSKPKGICGSALLDVVAGLLKLGIINNRGKLLSGEKLANPEALKFKNKLVKYHDEDAFLLVDGSGTEHGSPIVVTQSDVRQLQLAKGAIVAGIKILLDKCHIQVEDISEVLLAGAFGNYMNPHSACTIGLIPKELEDRIKMIGNAAGMGAKLALLSAGEYKRAGHIARLVGHVELASNPNFRTIFAKSTYF